MADAVGELVAVCVEDQVEVKDWVWVTVIVSLSVGVKDGVHVVVTVVVTVIVAVLPVTVGVAVDWVPVTEKLMDGV